MQTLKGMKDYLPQEQALYRYLTQMSLKISHRFCYQEISTPLLESTDVFLKTLGDDSDILEKELYQFQDRGGHHIALRPEGTASAVRFLINQQLYQQLPLRISYCGPMFRCERPQKGRMRQFHQFGVEVFGKKETSAEMELLLMAQMILKKLNIESKVQLHINTLGDVESRKKYIQKLTDYLTPYQKELSLDSQKRLIKNPLRILDSKSPQDQKILQQAPVLKDCLNQYSLSFYEHLLSQLQKHSLSFQENKHLVRGLDYYTHTVFEYVSKHLGAQDAVIAGGRYDSLVSQMGGKPTPATGWAFGIERMMLLCKERTPSITPEIALIWADESMNTHLVSIANQMRSVCSVYIPEASSLSKQIKKAHQKKCLYSVILGSNEWKKNQVLLKNMKTGKQTNILITQINQHLQNTLSK